MVILGATMLARQLGEPVTFTWILFPPLSQFVVVTLIFIILDRNKGKLLDNWDPRKLAAVKGNLEEGPNARSIFAFLVLKVATLWMVLTPPWPYLLLGPARSMCSRCR